MLPRIVLSALAVATFALGVPLETGLESRAVVNHDSLNPIPQRTAPGPNGDAIARFSPLLHIAHGCQPYTAVNDAGDTSGGLQDTGTSSGGCRDQNKGQTYARGAWYRGRFGILYAWYFPKDQPIDGNVAGGHRHDWESVVVWLNNPSNSNPLIVGAAASGHGDYKRTTNPPRVGNSVKVEYFTQFPLDHALQFTNTVGRTYPVSDWDAMPPAERSALQNTNFGKANVPFKDGNFFPNLEKAFV